MDKIFKIRKSKLDSKWIVWVLENDFYVEDSFDDAIARMNIHVLEYERIHA